MSANPYDPVTTTDTTTLSDDDWGLSLPGVRYKKYYGSSSRCKGLCQIVQERPKATAIVCLTILAVVMLIVIVAVSSGGSTKRHPTGEEPKWQAEKEGLEFYPIPEDKTIVISFNVKAMGNFDPIKAMLDNVTDAYDSRHQMNEDKYTDCKVDDSPFNKTCRFFHSKFGDECTSIKDYGYKNAMPCVFVQLNLPDDVMIKPIAHTSPLWEAAKLFLEDHDDPSSVPFVCQGKSKEDRDLINKRKIGGLDPIQYYPTDGFPSYFYRKRDTKLPFLKPAVMVRLTSLLDEHLVHVVCTAWGQLFKLDGSMEDHGLLTTEFAVYIKHRG